ncbi:MAG: molybdopterin-guanine dinucleotide biosynthesis protein MobB [Spirochaetales bacterium]|jgi:molybdopterin-guanine dinucleotide biosynthesis protein MobB
MENKPIIISIIGWSGSGKTTFIESAIAECAHRGIQAAAVKKSRHAADLPPEAKDSSRFRSAGANPSIYLSESEMVILAVPPPRMDAETVVALCPQASIIFCEGLDVPGAVLVLVAGAETTEKALKRPIASADILVARDQSMIHAAVLKNVVAFLPEQIGNFIEYVISLEETDAQQ